MTSLGSRYGRMLDMREEDVVCGVQKKALRVNTLRIDEKTLLSRLRKKGVILTKIPHIPLAYTFDAPFSLGATEEFLLGYYYLQEAASQLPVLALHTILGDKICSSSVLDMAAAPGSKTTQLAAVMQNKGRIVAIDESANRIKALADNLERCGVQNTLVYLKDANYAADLNETFTVVMLDAPCSGNFTLSQDWIHERTVHDVKAKAGMQKALLRVARSLLQPGGILVYSTCSLEPEENEGVLSDVLDDKDVLLDAQLPLGSPGLTVFDGMQYRSDCKNAVRVWPHKENMQGFFVAIIRKNPEEE